MHLKVYRHLYAAQVGGPNFGHRILTKIILKITLLEGRAIEHTLQ